MTKRKKFSPRIDNAVPAMVEAFDEGNPGSYSWPLSMVKRMWFTNPSEALIFNKISLLGNSSRKEKPYDL